MTVDTVKSFGSEHEKFMHRALELAAKGAGWVAPNPLVGCVIVEAGEIIGEGYHSAHGQSHAEPAAIADVVEQGFEDRLLNAVLYVTLGPCAHHGKTPPCSSGIIKAAIPKVVIATADMNESVPGNGVEVLRAAGVEVVSGVLEQEAKYQNRIFFHSLESDLPYVSVKVAISKDDKLTKVKGTGTAISGQVANQYVHEQRQLFDAILVGSNTVKIDDPQLTVRLADEVAGGASDPLRVILDGDSTVPEEARVFKDNNFLVFTGQDSDADKYERLGKIGEIAVLEAEVGKFALLEVLQKLARHGVTSLFVEGGQTVLSSFLEAELVDEWVLIRAGEEFNSGLDFVSNPDKFYNSYELVRTEQVGDDVLEYYLPAKK